MAARGKHSAKRTMFKLPLWILYITFLGVLGAEGLWLPEGIELCTVSPDTSLWGGFRPPSPKDLPPNLHWHQCPDMPQWPWRPWWEERRQKPTQQRAGKNRNYPKPRKLSWVSTGEPQQSEREQIKKVQMGRRANTQQKYCIYLK